MHQNENSKYVWTAKEEINIELITEVLKCIIKFFQINKENNGIRRNGFYNS